MFKKILLVAALIALTISFVGCSTVKGIGKDIQTVGEAGEKAID